jgi:hypothetical protein
MGFKGEISPMGGSPADQRLNADYPCLHSRFSKSVDFRQRLRMGISSDWMFREISREQIPEKLLKTVSVF